MNKSEITNWSILAIVCAIVGLSIAVAAAFLVFTNTATAPLIQQEVVTTADTEQALPENETADPIVDEEETVDEEILYNEDGSIDTSNWKTYQPLGFDVAFPPSWYYTQIDAPGLGFVGNVKRYVNADLHEIPQLLDDEIRVEVSAAPGDTPPNIQDENILAWELGASLDEPVWSCENVEGNSSAYCTQYADACSHSEIVSLPDQKYAIVQCEFVVIASDDGLEAHVISREIIQHGIKKGVRRTSMRMYGNGESALHSEVLDTMFQYLEVELTK